MLTDKFIEWLQSTGFPLEMEAASAFRTAGFDVRQSSTFPDPQSDKGREIDVLAQDPDFFGVIEIAFVIECKSSSKPWVVFTSDDALSGYNRLFAFSVMSQAARNALAERFAQLSVLGPYIKRPERGGYGFRQALGKEADPAYTAAMAALKACHGVAKDRTSSSIPRLAFAFPVIVVDSPLFECSRAQDGKLELTGVSNSEFLFSAYIPEHIGCCVKVITREHLPEFATSAKMLANAIREDLKDEEDRVFPSSSSHGT
ncbi:MAG: hypothetical protein HYU77_13465 [Betaproteobacteria bacterium]|nr:hypothetical protein [Betaproteobacteria bacterium]